eukprot:1105759-Pelagomonas_calceolata.AAC.1
MASGKACSHRAFTECLPREAKSVDPRKGNNKLVPAKLGLLLLLHATLAKPTYPCLGALAIKLKMKHMPFLTALRNTFVLCTASIIYRM